MSIITVSRRPFSRGSEVAARVAEKLGYTCVAREVLFEAANKFDVPDSAIMRAVHDAPSFSDHFHYGRERYVAFFQATLLELLQRDNIVYHGLAGHFFVQAVSHALKIRIITSLDERVRVLEGREKIGPQDAARLIKREDDERRKWSQHLYGVDTWDPSLYNMVLNISDLSVEEAAEIVCRTVSLDRFQTTPESQRKLDDLVVSALVKAALIQMVPDIEVDAKDGKVLVKTEALENAEAGLYREVERIAGAVSGVEEIKVQTGHSVRHYD